MAKLLNAVVARKRKIRLSYFRSLERVRDIHVTPSQDIKRLVDQMHAAGGFMGRYVADAAILLRTMILDNKCTKFLAFPAALIATGLRGVLVDMVKERMVDAIITTSGTLDHDIARTYASYYHGGFILDDVRLKHKGLHRLGNVLIPLQSYGPLIEKKVQPWLRDIYSARGALISSAELCEEFGRRLDSEESLLFWAQKNKVPVFIPGITDGSVGSQLWLFAERHRDFQVNLLGDERRLSEIVYEAKRTGAFIIGGGISKHHVIWWNLFRGGLDYACYITTATELDGSLSGAQAREAVSWGKIKERAKTVNLYAEASTVLPLIVSYALAR
jgi:deoxyhypusine synthase